MEQPIEGYELLKKLGQGGMGAVYLAKQTTMDRTVALKILPPKLARNSEFIQRFQREARAVAKLSHPNIVSGFDVGESNSYHYFAMEFIDGPNVGAMLAQEKQLPEKQALDIVLQISKALEHAESKKLVHRDIKPDNIMMTTTGVAKLADLGLAKSMAEDVTLTATGIAFGTPNYISPEQARGEKDLDIRTDIYSLGATLYHMLTGEVPFKGETAAVVMTKHINDPLPDPSKIKPDISKEAVAIIKKMMEKKREDRYLTAADLVKDLTAVTRGESPVIAMPPPPQLKRTRADEERRPSSRKAETRRTKKKSMLIPAMIVGALVLAGAVIAIVVLQPQPEDTIIGKVDTPDEPNGQKNEGKGPNNGGNGPIVNGHGPTPAEIAFNAMQALDEQFTNANGAAKYDRELVNKIIAACTEIETKYASSTYASRCGTIKRRYERVLLDFDEIDKEVTDVIAKMEEAAKNSDFKLVSRLANRIPDAYPDHPGAKIVAEVSKRLLAEVNVSIDKVLNEAKSILVKSALEFDLEKDPKAVRALLKSARDFDISTREKDINQYETELKNKIDMSKMEKDKKVESEYTSFLDGQNGAPGFKAKMKERNYYAAKKLCDDKINIEENSSYIEKKLAEKIKNGAQKELACVRKFWETTLASANTTQKALKLFPNATKLKEMTPDFKIIYENDNSKGREYLPSEINNINEIYSCINIANEEDKAVYILLHGIFTVVDSQVDPKEILPDEKAVKDKTLDTGKYLMQSFWLATKTAMEASIDSLRKANKEEHEDIINFSTQYLSTVSINSLGDAEATAGKIAQDLVDKIDKVLSTDFAKLKPDELKAIGNALSDFKKFVADSDFAEKNPEKIEEMNNKINLLIEKLPDIIKAFEPKPRFMKK